MPEAIPPLARDFTPASRTAVLRSTSMEIICLVSRQYYVYIMTNQRKTVLYTGVTNDLMRRVWQHRNGRAHGFTARYNCDRLVMYEVFLDAYNAISREKQIKAGSRRRKIELIERMNPDWRDLYEEL